ncbi:alpha/beta hydrolase [Paenarthrobacter aurescens]|nr:alpha/beta hydrolase [Paenarthrobacter aurescens]MDO6142745.1 alpha/beta hydrolase [Paenarthrobacter aurescens]MDO6146591.1 alpha/beta hydrolase [Paenarthrobacter aurescens]MDO6157837.1 alpha/beta hydrolase [Paenarthrobacter aurescens]
MSESTTLAACIEPALVSLDVFTREFSTASEANQRTYSMAYVSGLLVRVNSNLGKRGESLSGLANTILRITEFSALRDASQATKPWIALENLTSVGPLPPSTLGLIPSSLNTTRIIEDLDVVDDSGTARRSQMAGSAKEPVGVILGPSQHARNLSDEDFDPSHLQSSRIDPATSGQYPVWFATNRIREKGEGSSITFQNGRGHNSENHYGRALVSIPREHRPGSLRGSRWRRLLKPSSYDGPMTLLGIQTFECGEQFAAALSAELDSYPTQERTALVYVHGYNTSFKQAAIRAAQIGFDLDVEGITALYSWPSFAKPLAYVGDQNSADDSEEAFADFLRLLCKDTGATKVNLVVHSMGNRLLGRSIQELARSTVNDKVRFGAIILAAPDVDVPLFRRLATAYPAISDRTTMYVSKWDGALALAKALQTSDRAGFSPPVTVLPDIDTVQVRSFDLSTFGHGYYAKARGVIADMQSVLLGLGQNQERIQMRAEPPSDDVFWAIP